MTLGTLHPGHHQQARNCWGIQPCGLSTPKVKIAIAGLLSAFTVIHSNKSLLRCVSILWALIYYD